MRISSLEVASSKPSFILRKRFASGRNVTTVEPEYKYTIITYPEKATHRITALKFFILLLFSLFVFVVRSHAIPRNGAVITPKQQTSGNAGDENFSFLEALIAVLEECKDKTEANGSFIVAATIAITEGKQFKASPKDTAVPAWSKMKDHGKTLAKATKAAHLAATLMLLKNGIESDTLFNQNKKPILQYKDISVKSQPKNLKNEDWALLKEADAWVCEGGIKEAPRGADQNNIPKYKLEIVTTGSRTEKKFVEMNWQ